MALKPCRECKREISTKAKTCPHCGKTKPHDSPMETAIGGIILVVLIAGGLAWCSGDDDPALDTVASKTAEAPITATGLEGCVRRAMTNSTGVDRLEKIEIRPSAPEPEKKVVDVVFRASENLTSGLTRGGIEMAMTAGYHAIYTCGIPVGLATMEAHMPLIDKHGNEKVGIVYGTRLEEETARRINWENRIVLDWPTVWKTYWMHPGFRN